MYYIPIKPISLNEAYRGRRFTTPLLKQYKKDLSVLLPSLIVPEGKLAVQYEFGVSSKMSDGDNLIKSFQDAIAENYGFNDNMIYRWVMEKVNVKKGEEYVRFEILPFAPRAEQILAMTKKL